MKDIQREELLLFNKHSNMTEKGLEKALREKVYPGKEAWEKFLQWLILSLATGFTVSGIVFFFAYNWTALHKFAKIGLIEGLIIIATGVVLVPKININIKNIILTGTAVLVGVLFAVFGQIYQTGANSYDFFLGWTVFVSLWVFVSNFAPLWLLYLILVNTTLILYAQQVTKDWSEVFLFTLLFTFNTIVALGFTLLRQYHKEVKIPTWFTNTIALSAVVYATFGLIIGIWESYQNSFLILILLTAISYVSGLIYGLKEKSGFYLSIIPFSAIIISSALLIKISHEEVMFLFICLYIIGTVTLLIKNLLTLHKKWSNEN